MRMSDRLAGRLATLQASQVLEGLFDHTPQHLALVDRDGRIAATNPAWDRFCCDNGGDLDRCGPGADYREVLAAARDAGAVEAAAAAAQFDAALAGEHPDDVIYACDGPTEDRTFRTSVLPFPELDALLVVHASVTDERLAAQLHDELLLGISHGLSSSLAALRSAAAGLSDRPAMLRDPRTDELVADIELHTRQLETLLAGLLELERLVGTVPEPPTAVVLAELVEEVLARVSPTDGRELHHDLPRDLRVRTDPARLELAVHQLVANALQHTPPGSTVELHAGLDEEDPDRVVLLVDDNGPGIPIAERERLLQPFERGRNDRRGGPGLGIPIVDQLLRLSNERLWIGDRPGGGARFGIPLRRVR